MIQKIIKVLLISMTAFTSGCATVNHEHDLIQDVKITSNPPNATVFIGKEQKQTPAIFGV